MEKRNRIYHYPHPEWFDNAIKPDIKPGDRIVLWGAGKLGDVVAYALSEKGIAFECFVDSAPIKWDTEYCGKRIISPKEFYEKYSDCIVIVSSAFPIILDTLKDNGVTRAYDAHSFLMDIDFSNYTGIYSVEFLERCVTYGLSHYALNEGIGSKLEKLFFVITEKCSLRCVNCDAYIPYYTDPIADSVDTISSSYEKITRVCGEIDEVNLLGGEPMVHPNIDDIVEYFIDSELCKRVVIISNGTVVPSKRLTSLLKNSRCFFRLSDYGEHSRHKEDIIQLFDSEGIKYEVTNYQIWDRVPLIQETDETEEQLDIKYQMCTSNQLYVKGGRVFHCNFLCGITSFGEELFPNMNGNLVDLKDEDADQKLEAYVAQLHSRKHLDACRYCPGNHCVQFNHKVPVAEQTKDTLPIDELYLGGKRLW